MNTDQDNISTAETDIQPENAAPARRRSRSSHKIERPGLLMVCYACLLVGFLAGMSEVLSFRESTASESENRMLQGFPELSVSSVLSGKFMTEFESYLSDNFILRDETAEFTESQLDLLALPDDGPRTWDVDAAQLAETDLEEQDDEPAEEAAGDAAADVGEAASETVSEETGNASPQTAAVEVDRSLLNDVSLNLVDTDGNETALYTIDSDRIGTWAEILNLCRSALPADGTVNFILPPVSPLANNIIDSKKYVGWNTNLDTELNKVVEDGVYVYNVPAILSPYLNVVNLYPTQDHHWQPIAASLVAQAMLERQGVAPVDYYEYRYYVSTVSNYRSYYGDDLRSMNLSRDSVSIMMPLSPVEAYYVSHFNEKDDAVFIDMSKGGLLCYLGGLHPGPWRLFETGFHTGRTALVVTDSFGLTLTPFLAPYYDEILYVDLRPSQFNMKDSGGTIREYMDYYGIDDVYVISSAYEDSVLDPVQERMLEYFG